MLDDQLLCPRCEKPCYGDIGPCITCRQHDKHVTDGLRWARLTPLPGASLWRPWEKVAELSGLAIFHSGRGYWVVKGLVPLATAKALYEDPVGREMVRVEGDCTCPAPETRITWVTANGRKILPTAQRNESESFIIAGLMKASDLNRYLFSDCPLFIGGIPMIDGYHIASALGLRVFVDIVIDMEEMEQRQRSIKKDLSGVFGED